jgi:hypothetical protein
MKRVFFLCVFLAFAVCAYAAAAGAIKGYVRDASGAIIPGVVITLQNELTNVTQKTTSDENGFYQFRDLPPGSYQITAELTGFRKTTVRAVSVLVDQIVSLDLVLNVGEITQEVEVTAAPTLIEPDKVSTGVNFDPSLTAQLPMVNRRFNDIALLTPGATFAPSGTQAGGFAAAGSRTQSTNWMIDGINAIDPQVNGATNSYRIADAVQELSVITTAPSVEFGRQSGAQVNVVTKSGTNQFHGSAFWFVRNDILQAADFFTNKLGGTKNVLRRNQYGGTLGGPIRKDRSFFFYSWEALQQTNPQPTTATVPTQAQRDAVRDPIARNLLQFFPLPTDPSKPAGSVNYVGNLPESSDDNTHFARIDHTIGSNDRLTGRYIWFGGNTVTAVTLPNNSTLNHPGSQNFALTETHTFSPRLFAETRVGYSRNATDFKPQDYGFNATTVFPGVPGVVDATKNPLDSGLPRVAIAGYANLGGATNLPQGRITNTYELFFNATQVAPFNFTRHTFKFGYNMRREETRRFLDGNSRGLINFVDWDHFAGTCSDCNGQSLLLSSTIRTGDTLSHWYRYAHAFYLQDDVKLKPNFSLSFGVRYELPSVATEKRGKGSNFIPGIGPVLLGTNQLLDIDPTKRGRDAFVYGTAPFKLSNAGANADNNNFAPLFGFAYMPRFGKGPGDDKTVIRGGFRVGYDEVFNNIPVNQALNAPFVLTTTQRAGTTQPQTGYGWNLAFDQNVPLVARTTQAPAAPAVGLITWNAYDLNARTAYAYNWNLGIQRQITSGISIDVSYIGSAGHKLGIFLDANEPYVVVRDTGRRGSQSPNEQFFPYPHWGAVSVGAFPGNSIYNGLVLTGKLRLGNTLTMNGSYTWSHGIDNSSSFFGSDNDFSSPDDSRNLRAERGNSGNDQRHRFVDAFTLELPVGQGRRFLGNAHGIVEQVLGGWSISGIANVATGNPFTVYAGPTTDYSGFNSLNDRPDIVGAGSLKIDRGNPDNFFDPAYFGKVAGALCPGSTTNLTSAGCAPVGRVGSSPRNGYYGPGLINFDMTAGKTFTLHESWKLQYRADFFNLPNHTNFALNTVNRSMNNGQFGLLTSTSKFNGGNTGGPRVIQMTLRLMF